MSTFFMAKPNPPKQSDLIIHYFSSFQLSDTDFSLLCKGLSFTPTPSFTLKDQLNLLHTFDSYAVSLRHNSTLPKHPTTTIIPTHPLHKPMKFLKPKHLTKNEIHTPSNFSSLESYIHDTKELLNQNLATIYKPHKPNISPKQSRSIKRFKSQQHQLIIKPADKNLGIVLLNADDYIHECLKHLSTASYLRVPEFPSQLKQLLQTTLIKFSRELTYNIIYSKSLYHHLQPQNCIYKIPQFYGLPKIHKSFVTVPPIRPIVSQCNSLLSTTAKFLDHILQPLAKSYPDYLHNSTSLINILENTTLSRNTILVSLDIVSLFPSIPQSECLSIIHQELLTHSNLLTFNPNLIMQLLDLHLRNNYFEFGSFIFKQTTGIAMGAAFSPTVANIYMSVFIKRFLSTCSETPVILLRYIDDIFMLWPKQHDITNFVTQLNSYHPNIKFTSTISETSIDFLDLTISKNNLSSSPAYHTKTFQKQNNLYQYLAFSSMHLSSTFKGIIIGECQRYVRTNSTLTSYLSQIYLFNIASNSVTFLIFTMISRIIIFNNFVWERIGHQCLTCCNVKIIVDMQNVRSDSIYSVLCLSIHVG